jgi:hypothetical protein
MTKPTGSTRFKATEELEITPVPDGYVVYDEPREKVHYLNPTAAVVYTVCDGARTVDEIKALLSDAYDLPAAIDLDEFFTSLEQAGLVCRVV